MTQTITGLFNTHTEARAAVEALRSAGIDEQDISIVGNNADGSYKAETTTDTSEAAGQGAGIGAIVGGAGGLLTGLGIMAIPGVGPVVAAGWLAATAVGAAAGAAVGGAAGGLIGGLTAKGVPEHDAHIYAEGIRRGGTLVTAIVDEADEAAARDILNGSRSLDLAARERAFRDDGWTGFDENAPGMTRAEIEAERARVQFR